MIYIASIVAFLVGVVSAFALIRWMFKDYAIRCPWCDHRIQLRKES